MKKISHIFSSASVLFVTIALLATWLFLHSQVDYHKHKLRIETIQKIQAYTAELIRNVLLVEKGQSQNYDNIVETLSKNETLFLELPTDHINTTHLIKTWSDLKIHIEQIKSSYALYQNSLLYFPKGIENLFLNHSKNSEQKNFVQALLNLERKVMQYGLSHSQQTHKQLIIQLNKFRSISNKLPKESILPAVLLSKHAEILLTNHQQLQQLQTQILNTTIPHHSQLLLVEYYQNFQKQIEQAANIRQVFYIVCLLLSLLVIFTLSRLKSIISELHDSKSMLLQVANNAPVMLWMSDKEGNLVFTNEKWDNTVFDYQNKNIFSGHAQNISSADRDRLHFIFQQQTKKTSLTSFQYIHKDEQNSDKYYSANLVTRLSEKGEYLGFICSTIDITKQRLLEQETQLAAKVFENSLEGILISNANNQIVQTNRAFSNLTGYSLDEVIGKNPNILSSGMQNQTFYKSMWQVLEKQGLWQGEIYNRRKNGEIYPEWLTIIAVNNERQEITHHIAIFSDISEKKRAEQDIHFLAHYDPLTKLPNRTLFYERVQHAIHQAQRNKSNLAILFLDLDKFKAVNDGLGHQAGDELLVQVAEDLKHCIRDVDTVARIGGDEFIILLEVTEKKDVYREGSVVAKKIIQTLSREYHLKDVPVFIGASIGVSIFPDDGKSIEMLTQRADMAMYHAKENGRNNFQFYSEKLNLIVQKRLQLEADLRVAIDQQQFFLDYQPQYNLASQQIEGFEALIRWQHPTLGLLPPDDFITIAEESGLILTIGKWVLETAAKQLLVWQKEFHHPLRMAINVSVKQLEREGFVEYIKELLLNLDLSAEDLELEVTESIFLEEGSLTLKILNQLDQLGIQLSMDDFGTGYSNMSYLKKLPIDRIKIDRCFVSDLPHDANDIAIVCAIIDIARHFKIKVIAEGIEYQEQADYLLSKGCDEGQGYLLNKPLSINDASLLLNKP